MDSKCYEMTVSNQLRDCLSRYFYLFLPHLTALSRILCVMGRLAFAALGRPQGTADTLRLLRKRWDGGGRGQGEGRDDMKAGLGGKAQPNGTAGATHMPGTDAFSKKRTRKGERHCAWRGQTQCKGNRSWKPGTFREQGILADAHPLPLA